MYFFSSPFCLIINPQLNHDDHHKLDLNLSSTRSSRRYIYISSTNLQQASPSLSLPLSLSLSHSLSHSTWVMCENFSLSLSLSFLSVFCMTNCNIHFMLNWLGCKCEVAVSSHIFNMYSEMARKKERKRERESQWESQRDWPLLWMYNCATTWLRYYVT